MQEDALDARVAYLRADFRRMEDVRELAEGTHGIVDSLDVLINNAGIPGNRTRLLGQTRCELTFLVNSSHARSSPTSCCRPFAALLRASPTSPPRRTTRPHLT